MSVDLQQINDVAALIQKSLISVAVLIGGGWTVFTFRALNLRQKAKAELADLQRKINLKPLINISVTSEHHLLHEGSFLITAVVRVENVGTRDTTLFFPSDRKPFSAMQINFSEDGDLTLGIRRSVGVPHGGMSESFSRGAVVRAGVKVELPFAIVVPSEGIYMLSFATHPTTEDLQDSINAGAPALPDILWSGRAYVYIKPQSDLETPNPLPGYAPNG